MMSLKSKSDAPILALLALVLAWSTYLFVSFSPGAMSTDSFYIMQQARDGVFKDDHPPLMAMTWWLLAKLSSGQEVLLALNLFLFWGGAFLVFAALSVRSGWLALVGFVLFAIQPAILGILGVIWIDIFMAALLIVTVGALALAAVSEGWSRSGFSLMALVFGFLAIGARHNSAAAVSPLFAVALLLLLPSARFSVTRVSCASIIAVPLAILALFLWGQISKHVTERPNNMISLLAMYDIAGTAIHTGVAIPELSSLQPVSYDDLALLYTPRSVIPLQVGKQVHSANPQPTRGVTIPMRDSFSSEGKEQLMRNWTSAIVGHPVAYLRHRANVFASLIGLPPWTELWAPLYSAVLPNDMGVKPISEAEESKIQRYFRSLSQSSYVFHPFIYLTISILAFPVFIAFAIRKGDQVLMLGSALLLSGLAHMVGLFFIAGSGDFRYSHWLVVSTCLGIVIVLVRSVGNLNLGARQRGIRAGVDDGRSS